MSPRESAKIMSVDDLADELMIEVDLDDTVDLDGVMVGDPVSGQIFLTVHECPYCHSKSQTIGVCHAVYYCSYCASVRGRKMEMNCKFESLESEE